MYCMKCGKEVPEKQAFCNSCLAVMEQFPVRPGTRILLPNRPAPVVTKKAPVRKKALTTEARLERMRKAIQWLSVALAAVVLTLFLSITLLIDTVASGDSHSVIGQNYSTTDGSNTAD